MSPAALRRVLACGVALLAWDAAAANFGRQNYIQYCAGCHQMDGSGSPENGVPGIKEVAGHFLRLPEGRAYLVQVPGVSQAFLSDYQVAELLNWMLDAMSKAAQPSGFQAYTADEVRRLRATKLQDVFGTRRGIVEQLRGMGYAVD